MTTTPNTTRKLAAGVAAVVLTLSAAGAAVAVNLTDSGVESPAGKLTAVETVSGSEPAPAATPSTVYVDVTVPVPGEPTGSASSSTVPPSEASTPAAAGVDPLTTATPPSDDHHDDADDHDGHESSDDHHDGADDDD